MTHFFYFAPLAYAREAQLHHKEQRKKRKKKKETKKKNFKIQITVRKTNLHLEWLENLKKMPNDTFLIYMDINVMIFLFFVFLYFFYLGLASCPAWLPCNLHRSHSWHNSLLILHSSMFLLSLNTRSLLIHIFCLLPFMLRFLINNQRIDKSLRSCDKPFPIHHCFWVSNCRLFHRLNSFWVMQGLTQTFIYINTSFGPALTSGFVSFHVTTTNLETYLWSLKNLCALFPHLVTIEDDSILIHDYHLNQFRGNHAII